MEIDRIKEFIYNFESKFPVQHWQYDDVDIWPIFRILFFIECRDILTSEENNVHINWRKKSDLSTGSNFFPKLIRKVKNKLLQQKRALQSQETETKKHRSYLEFQPVLFFGSWYFRSDFQGRYINRFFEPLLNHLKEKYEIAAPIVEYFGIRKYKDKIKYIKEDIIDIEDFQYKRSALVYNIEQETLFVLFFKKFLQEFKKPSLEHIDKVIANKISNVLSYRSIYHSILQDYKPKYAICQTFFNEQMFAMIIAAKQRGIITIDLGHGYPNQIKNLVYCYLNTVPEQGYNSLPDIYWVWDESVKNIMDKSWVSRQSHHKVIVGGNPWLNLYQSSIKNKPISDKKLILYTMSINFPDPIIIDLMKNCSSDFEWWIRVHPALSSSLTDLESFLTNSKISNYNLEEANNLSLPEALIQCDIHFSNNSSSIYESIALGNIPIILDSQGTNSYEKYIKSGLAINGLNKNREELRCIMDEMLQDNVNINKPTLNFKLYEEVIDQLMSKVG